MDDIPRLIEVAFPLRQASLDSVREKYGPKGHLSGFHLWPARRPLAASRAALIATLMPDPGTSARRHELLEKIGGRLVRKTKLDKVVDETEGGILRWGREDGPDLAWFREEIRKAYGGRAPKVLDPFAGGGAIPLEGMRLGCEATAIDINPVAWFILKCTLEYPQRLAGQVRQLPRFALDSPALMEGFFKGTGVKGQRQLVKNLEAVQQGLFPPPHADLAWHVRAWGWWVLERARAELAQFYPVVEGKPTVAYLWARTVKCKNCRATLPLLKTRWLCKKDRKRVVLTMKPNAERTGLVFGVQCSVPTSPGSAAQKREQDKRIGKGTMSRSGATCPCCGTIMTTEDIRLEGQANPSRLGCEMTAVVVDGPDGKEYRTPCDTERNLPEKAAGELAKVFSQVPFGMLDEAIPQGGSRAGGGSPFTVYVYGLTRWRHLYTPRQLLALGTFVRQVRAARERMNAEGYPPDWAEALGAYLSCAIDRLVDHSTTLATWYTPGENVKHTFVRYALPITWDFAESNTIFEGGGSWSSAVSFCTAALDHVLKATRHAPCPSVRQTSVITPVEQEGFDIVMTDPPYYDAIPYSDLMDCFYVWLRRSAGDLSDTFSRQWQVSTGPKWNVTEGDGELIDDASRHGGDAAKSKAVYEEGMLTLLAQPRRHPAALAGASCRWSSAWSA